MGRRRERGVDGRTGRLLQGDDSRRAELVHAGFRGCVAVVAVVATLGVVRVGVDGLPFAVLVVLLLAAVVTILVAHR